MSIPLSSLSGVHFEWRLSTVFTGWVPSPAEVVDNDSDDNVNHGGGSLADQNGAGVKSGVLHLGCNGKIGWNASVTKNQGCHSRHSLGEGRVPHHFPVRSPRALLGGIDWTILDTSGNRESEDYQGISFGKSLSFVVVMTYWKQERKSCQPMRANSYGQACGHLQKPDQSQQPLRQKRPCKFHVLKPH